MTKKDAHGNGHAEEKIPFRDKRRFNSDGELIAEGYKPVARTFAAIGPEVPDPAKRFAGNNLACQSCHLDGGLRPNAMPWVGSYARFPQYRTRNGRVDLIEDRINDCFERSMNGRRLISDGKDMRDIVAYFAFLSTGLPVGVEMEGQGFPRLTPLKGDLARGAMVFTTTCARCHGDNGQGTALAPPLWGSRSYNRGAGMARINTAASFIYALMPIDRAVTLTPQAAFDVSTYINTRPRPEFPRRAHDWPRGGRPPDADYHILPVPTKEKAP